MIASVSTVVLTSIFLGGGGGMSLEEGKFWNIDRNHDQRIDQQEAKRAYNLSNAEVFKKYDRNNDGYILYYEFVNYLWKRKDDE